MANPDAAAPARKLPIGIQTFRTIREEGCYYVDKTAYMRRLIDEGARYFLSRPRRFGKSLFLDTLKELFEGNEPLFAGLDVHDGWDWSTRHPVLRLDFSGGHFPDPDELREDVLAQLDAIARRAGVASGGGRAPVRMRRLIEALRERSGQRVVVLVDEYDKPMLDALASPSAVQANRDALRGLYGAIKFSDAHVRFALLTGVSKFSKVSVFSDLNNLIDLTLDPRYAAVCGYTDADLDSVFGAELSGLDREAVRHWYNGYCWRGDQRVYNPFDILLLFRTREFKAHWFETGTPTFLVETLIRRAVATPTLERRVANDELLSAFDVDRTSIEALLFQTGYLTITGESEADGEAVYRLGYPNHEVRRSLNRSLLEALTPDEFRLTHDGVRLREVLRRGDADGLETLFRAFFAGIPHQWYTNNDIARYEGYYASVFYSHFAAAGLDVRVEESTSGGRLDMAVPFGGRIWLFEFKMVEDAPRGAALAQLKARRYADKYRGRGEPIHLIGIEFSRAERNVAAFTAERL